MHRIEAVRGVEEIIRRLRRAADPGDFGDAMRLDRELEARLDDGSRDRVMAAAGAQCRNLALVIAARIAERVLGQIRMMELRLGEIGHDTTFRSGVTFKASRCSLMARAI